MDHCYSGRWAVGGGVVQERVPSESQQQPSMSALNASSVSPMPPLSCQSSQINLCANLNSKLFFTQPYLSFLSTSFPRKGTYQL